jgi:nucleotide-binding universal stress UspA family protein
MKILLPVDGSVYTKRMLSYIAAHEELLGPGHQYTALTVVPAVPGHAARFLERATLDDYYATEAEQVLQSVREYARQKGWALECVRMTGYPPEAIAAHANAGVYDLIVMGTHGHSALGSAILGSVASGVLARCQTPVLLIR